MNQSMNRTLALAGSVSVFFLSGCHRHQHASDAAEETAQITVWSERYEIFAEHKLPVAGQAVTFITHVTDLKTLEPRREGPIKFVLRLGSEAPVEHPDPAPARAGIYLPEITFPKAGDWDVAVVIPTEGAEHKIELATLKVHASEADAAKAPVPEAPEGIPFLKEQQWKVLTKAEPATRRRMVERVRLPAEANAKPGFAASVAAPVAGQIASPAGGKLPLPGDRVEAGQVLALLRPTFSEAAARLAEAEGEFTRAQAALEKAEQAFERTRKLAEQKAKSERELQEAELAVQTARANHAAATALRSTYRTATDAGTDGGSPATSGALELRAPISGILNQVNAGPGEPVAAERVVFRVVNPETLWVTAHVPESAFSRIAKAGDASYELPDAPGQFISVLENGGRRVFVGLEVDAATRTLPVVYETMNREGKLRIGQSLNLYIETDRAEETLAVPDSAIVEEDGRPVAFVQLSGETFEKRDLTPGLRDGNWVQVLSGLKEGERVVTKGAYAIRLASVSSVIPAHGHAH